MRNRDAATGPQQGVGSHGRNQHSDRHSAGACAGALHEAHPSVDGIDGGSFEAQSGERSGLSAGCTIVT
jgi:hypothetical protein